MKNIISKILIFFTLNKMVKNKEVKTLLINIAIYIGIGIALGIYKAIVGRIPLLGNLSYNVAGLYKIYAWVGAILAAIQCLGNDDYSDVEYVTLEDIKNLWNLKNGKIAIIVAAVVLCLIPNISRALVVGSNDKKEEKVASSEVKEMEEDKQEEYFNNIVEENKNTYEEEYVEEIQEEIVQVEDEEIVEDDFAALDELYYAFEEKVWVGESQIKGVRYRFYENVDGNGERGAACEIIDDVYEILEEVEYEGNIYPVSIWDGVGFGMNISMETFTPPTHIKYITGIDVCANEYIIPDTVVYLNVSHTWATQSDFDYTVEFPDGLCTYRLQQWTNTFSSHDIKHMTIPDGATYLNQTFRFCEYLESVVLPDSLEVIDSYTFEDCHSLTEISLGKNLKKINEGAFNDCTSLASIDLPDGLESIEAKAFYGCDSLEELLLPDSVTECPHYWSEMPNLKVLVFPKDLPLDDFTFSFSDSDSIERIVFPNTLTDLEFNHMPENLKTIEVPDDLVEFLQSKYPDIEVKARE